MPPKEKLPNGKEPSSSSKDKGELSKKRTLQEAEVYTQYKRYKPEEVVITSHLQQENKTQNSDDSGGSQEISGSEINKIPNHWDTWLQNLNKDQKAYYDEYKKKRAADEAQQRRIKKIDAAKAAAKLGQEAIGGQNAQQVADGGFPYFLPAFNLNVHLPADPHSFPNALYGPNDDKDHTLLNNPHNIGPRAGVGKTSASISNNVVFDPKWQEEYEQKKRYLWEERLEKEQQRLKREQQDKAYNPLSKLGQEAIGGQNAQQVADGGFPYFLPAFNPDVHLPAGSQHPFLNALYGPNDDKDHTLLNNPHDNIGPRGGVGKKAAWLRKKAASNPQWHKEYKEKQRNAWDKKIEKEEKRLKREQQDGADNPLSELGQEAIGVQNVQQGAGGGFPYFLPDFNPDVHLPAGSQHPFLNALVSSFEFHDTLPQEAGLTSHLQQENETQNSDDSGGSQEISGGQKEAPNYWRTWFENLKKDPRAYDEYKKKKAANYRARKINKAASNPQWHELQKEKRRNAWDKKIEEEEKRLKRKQQDEADNPIGGQSNLDLNEY